MELTFFLKGLLIGIIVSAPVGPIGILCIKKTLSNGPWAGFSIGLGATTADTIYSFIAAFGLTTLSELLAKQDFWIKLIGGLALIYVGLHIAYLEKEQKLITDKHATRNSYLLAFGLTLTNPGNLLLFGLLFSGLNLKASEGSYFLAIILIVGVFCGSTLAWAVIAKVAARYKNKMGYRSLKLVNRLAGVAILILGIFFIYSIS